MSAADQRSEDSGNSETRPISQGSHRRPRGFWQLARKIGACSFFPSMVSVVRCLIIAKMVRSKHRGDGCWTCRLRRKKCDATRDTCGVCDDLGIPCYYGATKPDWMDGAGEQEKMAENIRLRIKNSVGERRRGAMPNRASSSWVTSVADYAAVVGGMAEKATANSQNAKQQDHACQLIPTFQPVMRASKTICRKNYGQRPRQPQTGRTSH